MIKAVPFLLIFLGTLFSCLGDDPVTVSFDGTEIDPELFTLPEGFVFHRNNSPSYPDLRLSVRETVGSEQPRFSISKEYLVPLKDRNDYRESMNPDEIHKEGLPLVPLSSWEYAGRGVMVKGLSPADREYPLVKWRHLVLDWNDPPDPVLSGRIEKALTEYLGAAGPDTSPAIVWLGAVGDMMLQRGIEDMLINRPDGKEKTFSDLLPQLSAFDLLMGNLEGAVTRRGSKTPKSYNFRFRPEVLAPLGQAGFDYLSLTNNHCYDYGEEGFLDTLEYLEEYGIRTSGAAESPEEALEPALFTLRGLTVRILSVGAYPRERNGFNGETEARVTADRAGILWYGKEALSAISGFSDDEGIDIVMVHGGHEWQRVPDDEQRSRYRSIIDAGADIVFGSHPHVLQGAESYKGGVIYYSLGNFLFNGMEEMPYAEDSLVASLGVCGGKILYRRDIPVRINGPSVRIDKSGRITAQFRDLSEGLSLP